MLKGIHPLLTGELLQALDSLGHGDTVLVADANFPARRIGPTIDMKGVGAPDALAAILTVLPLDHAEAAIAMNPPGGQEPLVLSELRKALGAGRRVELVERFAYYSVAAKAQLIVLSGELRPYGNLIVTKGTVNEWP
ncbi:MAG: RbsD/FucU family protein [Bifidobacteriaceae bacterium]|nr:RbsD/FucU family protein [Bifidobacteriaceae bacterium]